MPRGSGGRGRGSRKDDFDVDYEFDIFSLQADGQTPTTFSGAIENFRGTFNVNLSDGIFDFDDPERKPDIDLTNNPLKLNLQPKAVNAGETIKLLSGNPAIDSFDSKTELEATKDRLEFTFFSQELENLGIDEFTLIIEDDDPTKEGLQAGKTDINNIIDIVDIDTSLATANGSCENDAITYIIDNNLLSLVDGIRVSGGSIDNPGQIVSKQLVDPAIARRSSFTPNEGRPDNLDPDPGTDPDPGSHPLFNEDDVITDDKSDDPLRGEEGDCVLRGHDRNDVLETGSSSDHLDGGNGNDLLNCGAGEDVLVGDSGADIFVLNTLGEADIICDFSYDTDRIGLSDGITFDDLTISQDNGAAIISYQDQVICSVSGATPSQLRESLCIEI